ncbi:MAG: exodeoxyribonuclease V subunit gamma [Mariprofundus sp.]|nr:exodeoxyribonuclease V subunit gamma [Mariprofundus sp.]
MAFHLISSNKVELLMEKLAGLLMAQPLADPFQAETILVPSMPMQHWLGYRLAEHAGINCNNAFPLPASWIWNLVTAAELNLPLSDPLGREQAGWLIFQLLPGMLTEPAFAPLQYYLADDKQGIKRWQLSERIADLFDRYQYYRPELIRSWSRGNESDWQALLWRQLLCEIGENVHRVALIDRWLQKPVMVGVPERINLFAISSLPPLLLQVIQAVASHSDILLFYLTPTNRYWADLVSEKKQASKRLQCPDEAVYYESGHELLASWGRQGQVFQDLLLMDDSLQALEFDCHSEHWGEPSLLHQLQADLFHVEQEANTEMLADRSLQLHVCHSAMRECQVLHDELLKQLAADKALKPEDILVMVPEISRYAPYIEAVFSKDDARPFIPWNLSDISVADEHPVIRTFLQLLALPSSRFTLSEIMSLLDVEEIASRFALDIDAVAQVRRLLETLHVRWGIDGTHRGELGLDDSVANSWKQAEQRLLAGFAMGDEGMWEGVAPLGVGQTELDVMVLFWNLFERLNHWRCRLQTAQQAVLWQSELALLLDELFVEGDDSNGRLQQIRDELFALADHAGEQELSRELVMHWLQERLSQRDVVGRYFSGGVSFCGMRPMRSLPFKVICLLGMHDSAFPGREHPLEFDRMVEQWQPGDPIKGEMDRYLLLETVLCARNSLYISYTGRTLRDNSACQPSVLVHELLDMLEQQWGKSVLQEITHVHPMQPFSRQNYSAPQSAFDAYWCGLANAIDDYQRHEEGVRDWPEAPLPLTEPDDGREVALGRLIQFARHPVKHFFNSTLGIYLQEEEELCDDEPFALDGLAKWSLSSRLLDDYLAGVESDLSRLQAEGILPHGGFAERAVALQEKAVEAMCETLQPYREGQQKPQVIALTIPMRDAELVRLSGQVEHYYPGHGLLHVTASEQSGKQLLVLWLEHLALCAAGIMTTTEASLLVSKGNRRQRLPHLTTGVATQHLADYIGYYQQGLRLPLPLLGKSSWLYAKQKESSPKTERALLLSWLGDNYHAGDISDPYIAMVMRGVDQLPIVGEPFQRWAAHFYQPIVDQMEKQS